MGLKSLFWKDQGDTIKTFPRDNTKVVPPITKKSIPSVMPISVPGVSQELAGGTDYVKYLKDRLEELNLPGPDYLEFSKAVDSCDLPITLEQKYKICFAPMGIGIDKLTSSAEYYCNEGLNKEKSDFDKDLVNFRKEVTTKGQRVKALQEEINQLTATIQQKSIEASNLSKEIETGTTKLDAEQSAFESAYKIVQNAILNHITNIKTYLNGTSTK